LVKHQRFVHQLPYRTPQVATMISPQRVTSMRSGEV
jgi:hypothetical protein